MSSINKYSVAVLIVVLLIVSITGAGADEAVADRASGVIKTASTPPLYDGAKVDLEWNEAESTLTWKYGSYGDYDCNGEVNIADVTLAGFHWKEIGPFADDSYLAFIDTDDNDEINIADFAPLARYLMVTSSVKVYASYSAADYPSSNDGPNGPGAMLLEGAAIDLEFVMDDAEHTWPYYVCVIDDPPADAYYWIRWVDFGGVEGTPSNIAGGP